MNYRNKKLLDLANGAPCMSCGKQDGTTVAAHSNHQRHGKGMALKAHDSYIAFLCHKCHEELDHRAETSIVRGLVPTREYYDLFFYEAMAKTYLYLWQNELIKVA